MILQTAMRKVTIEFEHPAELSLLLILSVSIAVFGYIKFRRNKSK